MNSLKKSNDKSAGADVPMVAEAEVLLAKADKLATALNETGSAISADLAGERKLYTDLGITEIAGGDVAQLRTQLDAVRGHREINVRKRAAAAEGLVKLEDDLLQARRAADEARSGLGAAAIAEVQRRGAEAVALLSQVYSDAAELQRILHVQVSFPTPYRALLNLTGEPIVAFTAAAPEVPVAPPPSLQALTDLIARLDTAAGLAGGIRLAREADSHHRQLCLRRRTDPDMPAVYVVVKPVTHWGVTFAPTMLVDSTIINVSALSRYLIGRAITEATGQPAAAA